jgi:hypothetical protein
VTLVSSVTIPELSTWAMMVLGLVGLGFMGARQAQKESRKCACMSSATPPEPAFSRCRFDRGPDLVHDLVDMVLAHEWSSARRTRSPGLPSTGARSIAPVGYSSVDQLPEIGCGQKGAI